MNIKVKFELMWVHSILDDVLILKREKIKFNYYYKFSLNILQFVKACICSTKNAQAVAHDANTPAISGILK